MTLYLAIALCSAMDYRPMYPAVCSAPPDGVVVLSLSSPFGVWSLSLVFGGASSGRVIQPLEGGDLCLYVLELSL